MADIRTCQESGINNFIRRLEPGAEYQCPTVKRVLTFTSSNSETGVDSSGTPCAHPLSVAGLLTLTLTLHTREQERRLLHTGAGEERLLHTGAGRRRDCYTHGSRRHVHTGAGGMLHTREQEGITHKGAGGITHGEKGITHTERGNNTRGERE